MEFAGSSWRKWGTRDAHGPQGKRTTEGRERQRVNVVLSTAISRRTSWDRRSPSLSQSWTGGPGGFKGRRVGVWGQVHLGWLSSMVCNMERAGWGGSGGSSTWRLPHRKPTFSHDATARSVRWVGLTDGEESCPRGVGGFLLPQGPSANLPLAGESGEANGRHLGLLRWASWRGPTLLKRLRGGRRS